MTNRLESLQDLTGELIAGHLQVTHQTAAKRYGVTCQKCSTRMTGYRHSDLLKNPRCLNAGCDRPKSKTLADFQAEQEEQERAEREERERPLREVENKLTETYRELHKVTKETVATGREDEETWRSVVDTVGTSMSHEQAEQHNAEVVREYKRLHPEYLPTESNSRQLTSWFERNNVHILSVPLLEKAVARLIEYDLLEQRQPDPEPVPEPVQIEPAPVDDGSEEGFDVNTGERIKLSAYVIRRMSASDYQRFKRIPSEQLIRPVSPCPF